MRILFLMSLAALVHCQSGGTDHTVRTSQASRLQIRSLEFEKGSWPYFLQHLPVREGAVMDYLGRSVYNPDKAFSIVDYDIGSRDLQQCADAIMRLRAEYLFGHGLVDRIGFTFTSGHRYAFRDYCRGVRPKVRGNTVSFIQYVPPVEAGHGALRKYLDIVYTYAGTISLARELKGVTQLGVGTVIIQPGSPGHCSIIVDEGIDGSGNRYYKLAESYTPAQSIYLLRNTRESQLGEWHRLRAGSAIVTASYQFREYKLGVFE